MPKRLTPRGEAAPPVEPIVTGATLPTKEEVQQKKTQRKPKVTDDGVRYVRNLHTMLVRVTFTTKREIMLQPRGQREDIDIVSVEEQKDPKFLANKGLIFEVLTSDEAQAIIYKQQTNSRQAGSPLHQALRNERGEAYEPENVGGTQETFGSNAITVGQVSETAGGRYTDKNSQVTRSAGAQYTEAPGSPGHKATEFMQSVPSGIAPDEYHEFLVWKQRKAALEAEDGSEA